MLLEQNALDLSFNGLESACFDLLGWAAIDLKSAVTCINRLFQFRDNSWTRVPLSTYSSRYDFKEIKQKEKCRRK